MTRAGVLLAVAVLIAFGGLLVGEAYAQETKRPRTLMELLFRSPDKADSKKPSVKPKKSNTKKQKARVAKDPAIVAVDKRDNAKTILVVGDFLGSGLAEGLVSAYTQNGDVRVLDRTQGSSGFVRNDVYDWPAEIKKLIETEKPAVVVAFIGSNDRQQMRIGEAREEALTAPWTTEYTRRVTAMTASVGETRVPFVWIGLPAFKSTSMTQDIVSLNDIYKNATQSIGGDYVDIWDGFVDEKGAYVTTGPDINGQPVRLRSSDGINLSAAGKRKVAFYAEKPLAKLLIDESMPLLDPLGFGAPPTNTGPYKLEPVDRTQPMSLGDPELDGGSVLLGYQLEPRSDKDKSVGEKLAVHGIAPVAKPGRADFFGGAITVATVPAPTLQSEPVNTATPLFPPGSLVGPARPAMAPEDAEPAEAAAGPETTTAIKQ